jgi:hypothetical protein
MKLTKGLNIAIAGIVALGATIGISQPSRADHEKGFYCDTSRNSPVTVYRNHEGGEEPWIRWTSNYFKNAGYDPLTRCHDVSHRLERYRQDDQLRFITTGRMNKQNVICTASEFDQECDKLILTLKPKEDPERALDNLFSWHTGGGEPSERGRDHQRRYIDVREHLGVRKE